MKLGVSHQRPEHLTPARLAYLRAMGVESLEVRITSAEYSLAELVRIKDTVEGAGLKLHEIMLNDKYSAPEVCLGLPGREQTIDLLKRFICDLGKAGIKYTTYAWSTLGTYETGRPLERGLPTRGFEQAVALAKPNAHERAFSDEQMWANYEHFMREILPVAEEADVRLQLHPNDPPVSHQGIARIIRSTEGYRRALEISNYSPYAGILFCVGTYGEMTGPDGRGEDVVAAVREFGRRGLIHQVHFRNVDSPLPNFRETFPDNGWLDMPAITRALQEVGFEGMLVPDHVPDSAKLEGGPNVAEAFIFGYIRGLIQSARR